MQRPNITEETDTQSFNGALITAKQKFADIYHNPFLPPSSSSFLLFFSPKKATKRETKTRIRYSYLSPKNTTTQKKYTDQESMAKISPPQNLTKGKFRNPLAFSPLCTLSLCKNFTYIEKQKTPKIYQVHQKNHFFTNLNKKKQYFIH